MAKTKYFAIDANGVEHTRSSERVYTHTVVYKASYEHALASAMSKEWDKQEARNFAYYVALANRTHEHAQYVRSTAYHPSYTAVQIDAMEARKQAEIEKRIVDAAERIKGFADAAAWCAAERADRVAGVEKNKAEGYYDKWFNAGWNGRLGLAQTLANKCSNAAEVQILEAKTK